MPAPQPSPPILSRQAFLKQVGTMAFWMTLAAAALQPWLYWLRQSRHSSLRSGRFHLGYPHEFQVGQVVRFGAYQLWLIRTSDGFYALHNACTHLGCPPQWNNQTHQFQCHCHGSQFSLSGQPQKGPANRALARLAIHLSEEGQIVVDTHRHFTHERGEWSAPEAFLRFRS